MKRRRQQDNRGITLVEVIISMLVLAMIVVPLLSSFVLSSRVNLKSRTKQYALTLSQNVIESLKNYGMEEVALQFNNVAADGFSIVPSTSITNPVYGFGFYEMDSSKIKLNVLSEHNSIGIEDSSYYFRGNADSTYYYTIKDVLEGTKRFDVDITVTAKDNYDGDEDPSDPLAILQNEFKIPDVSNLDEKETALINPGSVGLYFQDIETGYSESNDTYAIDESRSTSYEEAAMNYFMVQHYNYYNQLYNEERARIVQENAMEEAAALLAGRPPNLQALPNEPNYKKVDYLRTKVSRKTIINIFDSSPNIVVNVTLEYKFNQGLEPLLYTVGGAPVNTTKEFGGFYHNVSFEELKNIYLFHTPLAGGKWYYKYDGTKHVGDIIEVNNTSSAHDLNIFIAQQKDAYGSYVGITPISVSAIGTPPEQKNRLKFYYYNDMDTTMDLLSYKDTEFKLDEDTNYFKTLVTAGETKDRIYEITVQVFEHGSSEILSDLTSTFTR